MYIYEEGKKLINLKDVLVIRISSYADDVDYIELERFHDTAVMVSVPKGEGKYALAGIARLILIPDPRVYTVEEIINVGKSLIKESDK
jgi:hypothetical protein